MTKIRIIDLLNKIANGEEVPKKIRITDIDDRITTHYNFFYDEDEREYKDDDLFPLGARLILDRVLNYEVEIIEEDKEIEKKKIEKKKIEKLDSFDIAKQDEDEIEPDTILELDYEGVSKTFNKVYHKINELIDKVNSLENKQ